MFNFFNSVGLYIVKTHKIFIFLLQAIIQENAHGHIVSSNINTRMAQLLLRWCQCLFKELLDLVIWPFHHENNDALWKNKPSCYRTVWYLNLALFATIYLQDDVWLQLTFGAHQALVRCWIVKWAEQVSSELSSKIWLVLYTYSQCCFHIWILIICYVLRFGIICTNHYPSMKLGYSVKFKVKTWNMVLSHVLQK